MSKGEDGRTASAEQANDSTLVLGPGPRLALLSNILQALRARAIVIQDLEELASIPGEHGVLLLDADATPDGDLGYVRRFIARRARFTTLVVGVDAGARVARTLHALSGARWLAWPPDVEEVARLAGSIGGEAPQADPRSAHVSPAERGSATPPERSVAAAHRPAPEPDDEIDAIEAILAGSARPDDAPRAGDEHATKDASSASAAASAAPLASAPRWWRAQVADLADAVQRLELGMQALRDTEPDDEDDHKARVDTLDAEIARLVMFARTLGYLAAPPARGAQTFDLSELVQVFVAELGSSGADAPQCQVRSEGNVTVRSDRTLLGTALDAIFYLVRATSRGGELVRAQVRRAGTNVEARIDFPAGPLGGLEPAEIVEPYALRRILPDLGPNALSAAKSIVAGQGGRVELARPGAGRLEWRIELPGEGKPSRK